MDYGRTKSGFEVKIACVSCKYKTADSNGQNDKLRYCKLNEEKVMPLDVCGNYRLRADLSEL